LSVETVTCAHTGAATQRAETKAPNHAAHFLIVLFLSVAHPHDGGRRRRLESLAQPKGDVPFPADGELGPSMDPVTGRGLDRPADDRADVLGREVELQDGFPFGVGGYAG